jgi:isopropylmalate/homocitrate/citramalate synthase
MGKEIDFYLFHRHRYQGQVAPENLIFNANLQEFTQKISYICSLETAGKLTPEESYQQIKTLWKQLKRSKKQLGIGQHPFQDEQGE